MGTSEATQAPLNGLMDAGGAENSTAVRNYDSVIESLTNLIIVIVAGGAAVTVGGGVVLLRTLLQLATLIATFTPSIEDDKFIAKIVAKIEGRETKP